MKRPSGEASGLQVRMAVPEDAAGIAAVNVASWQSGYRDIVPDAVLDALSVEQFTAGWRRRLETDPRRTLVCEQGSSLIGFAGAGPARDEDCDPARTAEVYTLYVAPVWWGRGAGRALWEAARARLHEDGFDEMVVWVLEANARARAFYERVGARLDTSASKTFEAAPGVLLPEVRFRAALGHIRKLVAV